MSRKPHAEIFIKTLQDLLDDERECLKLRRRLQHRDRAERFVQAFWAKLDADRPASAWIRRGRQPDPGAARQARTE